MSHYDYECSKRIDMAQFPFAALVMAAMRRADTENVGKLMVAFPEVYDELEARYNAPGGVLPNEVPA